MRVLFIAVIATLFFSACGQDSGKAAKDKAIAATEAARLEAELGTAAVLSRSLPLADCMAEHASETDVASSTCPTFILLAFDYLTQECTAAGGELKAAEEAEAWTLDVEGDGKDEMLVDLTRNFICYGAPAVFSCGSIGCPYFLYSRRGAGWVEIGAVSADDAPKIEVLAGEPGVPAPLRGGCQGERPCSELTQYEWNGNIYNRAWIEFRGYVVDVVPGGLWTLTKDAPVRAAPAKNGPVIDEYETGTAMVVLGSARAKPYQYVSPCNACRRGFVETEALAKSE